MEKKLYKSSKNKMIDGVCAGIAEYFNIDPTLVRIGLVLFSAMGGAGKKGRRSLHEQNIFNCT